jgi:D-alanyl-D-alanine carboxypeptidase
MQPTLCKATLRALPSRRTGTRLHWRQVAAFLRASLLLTAFNAFGQVADLDSSSIDSLIAPHFKPNAPGAAVIVTKEGKTIFRKGYGLANVEMSVALTPDMVFRIGSVTKQFTAVAIQMLEEQKKLSRDDDIGRYLPEFSSSEKQSADKPITIEHLLTHTSGLGGYTEAPEFLAMERTDVPVAQIVSLIRRLPRAFPAGEQAAYSNSGYYLLGAIIEKVSGMPYADFMTQHIFSPLDMKHTRVDRNEEILANRVNGYTRVRGTLQNAPYLSMTLPYSGGALRSTVDDLAIWNTAMMSGKLLTPASWAKLLAPVKLRNGQDIPFANGRLFKTVQGVSAISQGGRINGFVAGGLWLPSEKVYVAVLSNDDSHEASPAYLTQLIAAHVVGKPYPTNKPTTLTPEQLDRLVGVYKIDAQASRYITREGSRLMIERTGGRKTEIIPVSATEFYYPNDFPRVRFVVDAQGEATHLVMMQNSTEQSTLRTSKTPRTAIMLPPADLDRLAGEYVLGSDFVFRVTRDGSNLVVHVTGQSAIPVFARSPTRFFYKVIDAELEFGLDTNGRANKLTLYQGDQVTSGVRR